MSDPSMPRHQITRVRRETRRRTIRVTEIERLTPRMRRIRFASPDLRDFSSASPDDHIKLFVPATPEQGGRADGFCMRDYTPRAFDPDQGALTIDFAIHEAGPATAWALAAQLGDEVDIGGPRGSSIVADDFDWYLLIGDETALPAIGRRVEALRPGAAVTTLAVIETEAERQTFATAAAWTQMWVSRDGKSDDDAELLRRALSNHIFPPGDGYVWIAAEARAARAVRGYIADTIGHPKAWIKASGYWTRGEADVHETIED